MIFLKLGGSLITDKTRARTLRPEVLDRLVAEIASARAADPQLRLVLGHGSGSFGHVPARRYGTQLGVHSREDWAGFAEVWSEARALNQEVCAALSRAGLPVVAFPPSAAVTACDGQVQDWNLYPLRSALANGLIPLVYGDVVFDTRRGGTILSTEDLFFALTTDLHPRRILLAGLEEGVWADYPQNSRLIPEITSRNIDALLNGIQGSAATDVTGGMLTKVGEMLELVRSHPSLEIFIFSGMEPGLLYQALLGAHPGTAIRD